MRTSSPAARLAKNLSQVAVSISLQRRCATAGSQPETFCCLVFRTAVPTKCGSFSLSFECTLQTPSRLTPRIRRTAPRPSLPVATAQSHVASGVTMVPALTRACSGGVDEFSRYGLWLKKVCVRILLSSHPRANPSLGFIETVLLIRLGQDVITGIHEMCHLSPCESLSVKLRDHPPASWESHGSEVQDLCVVPPALRKITTTRAPVRHGIT